MKLLSTKQISPANQAHNAFTDMIEFNGQYFVCFRQATNHVSKDGFVRILVSDDLSTWRYVSMVKEPLTDLRDPKLSVDRQGRLTLLYYRKQFDSQGRNLYNLPCVRFSTDGVSWSSERKVGENNWWLWRLSHNNDTRLGTTLGIAYQRSQNRVRLYAGDPHRTFTCIQPDLFSLATHGKGYPNESDIVFLADGTAVCLLRRDADTGSAQIGIAKAPYKNWQWIDGKYYLGGPTLSLLNDGRIIAAARAWSKKAGPITALFELELTKTSAGDYQAKLVHQLSLPSSGDNSYPAIIQQDEYLYVSYYSEHQSDTCQIYLAKIALCTQDT